MNTQLANTANNTVTQIINAVVTEQQPAVIVKAPPGSGKTYLSVEVAAATQHANRRCGIACQTTTQTIDLATRLHQTHPELNTWVLQRAGATPPPNTPPGIHFVNKLEDLPDNEPAVICATTARWAARGITPTNPGLDLLIIDEAFQLTDALFAVAATAAQRYLMVGDPGQIEPVTTSDITPWATNPTGPHQPAPTALQARHPTLVTEFMLPATRRLGPQTTNLIQNAFYPKLTFGTLRENTHIHGPDLWAQNLPEIILETVPATRPQITQPEIVDRITTLTQDALNSHITTHGTTRNVTGANIAISCPHVTQVTAVTAALANQEITDILVDTTNRLQGLERDLIIVWHPLAGRTELTEFSLNPGRYCVSLSRHRTRAVLVTTPNITDLINRAGASGQRPLHNNNRTLGWQAHHHIHQTLQTGLS